MKIVAKVSLKNKLTAELLTYNLVLDMVSASISIYVLLIFTK